MKLLLICAFALFACAHARTATRAPAVTAQITGLTDKDARRKAATHPAFANAGRQAGVEVWRIQNFEPVPVPQGDYGKFHKGDSYIVLKTNSDKRGTLSWDLHYWIGSESSQDESGAAAILTVGLDDKLGGAPVQHRETLGYESQLFNSYFPNGIKYLDGGNPSGFNHVTTNAGAQKRLIQVKGKRNVRVRQVDPVISSMNKGDVFILDVDNDIYVYVGEKAKNVEKLKAISVANQVRDQDHHGRGRVEIIDQYSSEVDTQKFFAALGSGTRDLVPEETAGGDDQQFERSEEQSVTLSEVSEAGGKMKVTPVSKPLKQEQLKPQEAYILDTVSGSIYVWIGKQATEREKSEAMSKAQQTLTSKKYPAWVRVEKIPQGTETAIFKQYFATWRDVNMPHSRVVRQAGEFQNSVDETRKESRLPRPAQEYRDEVRMRSGAEPRLYEATLHADNTVSFEPQEFKQTVLGADEVHVLEGDGLTVWVGSETPDNLRKAAQLIADAYLLNFSRNSAPVLIIKQGIEPEAFVNMFENWDSDMWQKQSTDDTDQELEANEIDIEK